MLKPVSVNSLVEHGLQQQGFILTPRLQLFDRLSQ